MNMMYLQEDELKKEGGKYAHLNEELHVLVEVYSEISDAYARLSHALSELAKFLSPVSILLHIILINCKTGWQKLGNASEFLNFFWSCRQDR